MVPLLSKLIWDVLERQMTVNQEVSCKQYASKVSASVSSSCLESLPQGSCLSSRPDFSQ